MLYESWVGHCWCTVSGLVTTRSCNLVVHGKEGFLICYGMLQPTFVCFYPENPSYLVKTQCNVFSFGIFEKTLNINWADAFKRILPNKRLLCWLGHATRSREEVWQKLCLLDTFKYSINAEMAGNANNDSLNRSLTLTGDQVLITLWMRGTSFHSTDLVLVAYNCVSSVHFSSCCWCKTENESELSLGIFYCQFFSNCFVGTFFSLILCYGWRLLEKSL